MMAVYGNIDDLKTRQKYPENQKFEREGARIWITHIGGHPKRYAPGIARQLAENPVDIFICGHSHILKAGFDHTYQLLHLNPGAAGRQGWHTVRTAMRFEIANGRVEKLDVIELGPRGR